MSYWDQLEEIIDIAKKLQVAPAPESDIRVEIHKNRLRDAFHQLSMIYLDQCPEVWVGHPDDPARRGLPMG